MLIDTQYCKSNINTVLTWEWLAALQEVTACGGGISAEGGTLPGGSCCPSGKGCESSLGVLVHGEITLVYSGTGIGTALHDTMIQHCCKKHGHCVQGGVHDYVANRSIAQLLRLE